MDLSAGAQKLMGYFGAIQSAVSQGVNTADLWSAVKGAASAVGETLSGVSILDMNTLRSTAASIRNATTALANAGRTGVFDPATMTAQAPWARPLAEQNVVPLTQVQVEQQLMVNGEFYSTWRTVLYEGNLPTDLSALYDLVEADAAAIAAEHGQQSLGITGMSILAV